MKRWEKQSDFLSYLIVRPIFSLPFWLFKVVVAIAVSLIIANNTGVKKTVLRNISLVFPRKNPEEKRRLLRRILREAGINLYHSYQMVSRFRVKQMVKVEGLEHLDGAMAQRKGIIALSAHLSNFALLLSYLSRRYPFKAVVNNPKNPYFARKIMEIRRLAGISEIPRRPADQAVSESLHWLKAGKALFLLADEHRKKGIPVPFFGYPVGTSTTPAVFSRRLDCVVLPVSIVRQGPKYLIKIEPPLNLVRTDRAEEDIRQNTILFNQVIERWVRTAPDQWFGWFTRRFR
ncbi:MAG: lysophospholipid acyltransferase family protein [Candidatus Omnitrophota bacterium]